MVEWAILLGKSLESWVQFSNISLFVVHLESTWSPGEIQVDYACQFGCAPSQKKITWTPAKSTWNMWGKVKSSRILIFQ